MKMGAPDTDMKERLLPCPFCGGENIGWKYREAYSCDSSYAFFGCRDCGMGTDDASMDDKMHPEDVSAWNARAPGPRITDLEARLAAAEAGEDALAKALQCWIEEEEGKGRSGTFTAYNTLAAYKARRSGR